MQKMAAMAVYDLSSSFCSFGQMLSNKAHKIIEVILFIEVILVTEAILVV
jgi:hypothetical protein